MKTQKNGRKSQITVPATFIHHAVRGLPRLLKVGFVAAEIAAAKALLPRLELLEKKSVIEHRMRLDRNDAIAMRSALILEAEYVKGGGKTPDPIIAVATNYLRAYIEDLPLPKLEKSQKPGGAGEALPVEPETSVIEAGVTESAAVPVEVIAG